MGANDNMQPVKAFLEKEGSMKLQSAYTDLCLTKSKGLEKTPKDWKQRMWKWCEKNGVHPSDAKFDRTVSTWVDNLPDREKHGLVVHRVKRPGLTCLDTSQSIERMRYHLDHDSIPTITPAGRLMLFPPFVEAVRPMLGFEMLRLQGFPGDLLEHIYSTTFATKEGQTIPTDALLADLGGNAFTGTIAAALFMSVILHAPRHRLDLVSRRASSAPAASTDGDYYESLGIIAD